MNESQKQTIISIALIVFGLAAIFVWSSFLERNTAPLPEGFEDEDLSVQGGNLKGYALGFEGLLADWYWMKSLQYVGDKLVKKKDAANEEAANLEDMSSLNTRLLYPYLDNATTLDPKFTLVYNFGAVVLPAVDKEQAIKLTEKGIRDDPSNWRLYHYLGFIYWRLENYPKAAEIYEQGSKIEGAPPFMRQMAAHINTEGGSRQTARSIYQQMFEESEDGQVKETARIRLLQLDALDERDVIQKVLDNFKLKNNRCANNLREIFPLLKNEKLPDGKTFRLDNSNSLIDPNNAPYVLDNEKCTVKSDPEKNKTQQN